MGPLLHFFCSVVGCAPVMACDINRQWWKWRLSSQFLSVLLQSLILSLDDTNNFTIRVLSGKYPAMLNILKTRSRGLDVTWQPVIGALTVHPWTVTLPWVQSVGSETPLNDLVYFVTVSFTNPLPFNGDFCFGKSQKSQEDKSGLYRGWENLGDAMLCQK